MFFAGFFYQDDQTPLHISSRLGKQDIVQQLLANGAYPDATTNSGYTPLHLAAREGHRDIAATLLDHGASLGITTKVNMKLAHKRNYYSNPQMHTNILCMQTS